MATVKITSLAVRTLAKPIATQIKAQVKQHETFRKLCVGLAQTLHRSEIGLRTRILGEPTKHIRPLSETRAIESGANALSEGFLFSVAALIIIGEAWRSAHKESKRREAVRDDLTELDERLDKLEEMVTDIRDTFQTEIFSAQRRNDELYNVLQTVVDVGLRGGWAEFKKHPLELPSPNPVSPPLESSENQEVTTDSKSP